MVQIEQVPQTDHLKIDRPYPGWSQWLGRTRSLHLVPTSQHIHQPRQQYLGRNKGIVIGYTRFTPFWGRFLINAIFTTESDLLVNPQEFVDSELYLHVPSFPGRSSCDGCTETQRSWLLSRLPCCRLLPFLCMSKPTHHPTLEGPII